MFSGVLVFFVFHAKSGTTNSNPNGSSDISYYSILTIDSNGVKSYPSVKKNRFKIFDFSSNFERIKRASWLAIGL